MIAESSADGPADGGAGVAIAAEEGKYDVGEIASGVATGCSEKVTSCWGADAEAGPLEDTDGVLLIFSFRVFLVFSIFLTIREFLIMYM